MVHPLPRVTCHMSRVTCHLSPKMLFLKSFISWVEDQNLTTFVVGLRATKFNTSLAWVVVKEPLKCEHELEIMRCTRFFVLLNTNIQVCYSCLLSSICHSSSGGGPVNYYTLLKNYFRLILNDFS